MWWKIQGKKALLTGAVIWTAATVTAALNVFFRHDGWWAIISILFAINAVIRWISYLKKRQEEQNHE